MFVACLLIQICDRPGVSQALIDAKPPMSARRPEKFTRALASKDIMSFSAWTRQHSIMLISSMTPKQVSPSKQVLFDVAAHKHSNYTSSLKSSSRLGACAYSSLVNSTKLYISRTSTNCNGEFVVLRHDPILLRRRPVAQIFPCQAHLNRLGLSSINHNFVKVTKHS